jgi:hypothetical protein
MNISINFTNVIIIIIIITTTTTTTTTITTTAYAPIDAYHVHFT